MFVSAGLWYKSMLSAAIHYATLNSFRSIKLRSSLYKPPVLMLAPPYPLSWGILLRGRRYRVLCRIYWAIAKWTVGVKEMHELIIFSIVCIGSCMGLTLISFFPQVSHNVVGNILGAADWKVDKKYQNIGWFHCCIAFWYSKYNQSTILALAQSWLLNGSMKAHYVWLSLGCCLRLRLVWIPCFVFLVRDDEWTGGLGLCHQ